MENDNGAAGAWVVIRDWGISVRQIKAVTPKMFRLGDGASRYPTQIGREDRRVIACVATREIAERIRDGLAGIDGEYQRRRNAANDDYNARLNSAEDARQKAISRLVASAAGARSDETAQPAQPEGRQSGDAQQRDAQPESRS